MSMLLRGLLAMGFAGLLMVGCGQKEEAPVEEAPVAEAPAEVAPAPAAPEVGGYEPGADERVPGIEIDPAKVAADAEAALAASAAEVANFANNNSVAE